MSSGCLRTHSAHGITPNTNISPASISHAARHPHWPITNCVSGASTITPTVSTRNTRPVARPRYRWNHFPAATDVPIFTPPWSAMRETVNAT